MMSLNPKLRETPISASPTASFKWFELTLKLLKGHLLPFYIISMIAPFLMMSLAVVIPIIGLALAYIIYTFYCVAIFNVCLKKSNNLPVGFKDFFSFDQIRIKPLIFISLIAFVLSVLISLPASSALINFIKVDPTQFEQFSQLNYQEMVVFLEKMMLERPEQTAQLARSFLVLALGLCLIEAMMFFVPALLSIHKNLNITDAIKLNFIGLFKNTISFIPYGLVLFTLLIFSMLFSIFGFPLFLMLLKVSSFAAYQEIFLEPKLSQDDQRSMDETDLDSRDF